MIERSVQLSLPHRVFFTDGVFAAGNDTMARALGDTGGRPRKVLAVVEASVAAAQPDLTADLTAWFLHRRPYSEDKWRDIRNIILYMAPTAVLHGGYDVLVSYDLNVLGYSVVLFSIALLCLADWMSREELTWGEVVARWNRRKPSPPAHRRPRRIPPAAPSHSPRPRGGGGGRRFEIPDKDEQDPPLVS